jgi:hypothetical protein
MDDPLAVALKFGFLAVLYLFLLWVVRSARRDLAGGAPRDASLVMERPAGVRGDGHREGVAARLRAGVDPQLVVVAAMGHEPGTVIELGDGATLGRSESADIPIDDPYASSAHARIFPRGEFMYIEDMGSTNGTFLNGRQVRRAEQLKVADSIRIGDSEYRYEE